MARFYVPKKLRERLVKGRNYIPRAREFVSELIALAGGPRELARIIWSTIHDKNCPPSVRARALEIILKAMKNAEDEDGPTDVSVLDDDELGRFIDERIEQMVARQSEEPESAAQAPAPEAP